MTAGRPLAALLVILLLPALALGQGTGEDFSPPPLVDAPSEQNAQPSGEEVREGYLPQGAPQVPYPYSPHTPPSRPGPEVGLMVTESLFGMLTAAGTGLLGWYLLVKPMAQSGVDPTVGNLIFGLTFASVPMAVAQTQVNLANGSRHYHSESWPAYLSALGTQAAVIGLYYLLGGINGGPGAERVLLVGTVVGVPIATMAVINLTKQPRRPLPQRRTGALVGHDPQQGWALSLPRPSPLALRTARGLTAGVLLPLAHGRF